jgi:hypothetical protein
MTPEARALAQGLLDHHRQLCQTGTRQEPDFDSCLIPYGGLCDKAGVPHLKPTVGSLLREIAHWCHENGWPPLNSLAVNHETRRPGHGYDGAPGCSLERWRDQAAACIEFAGYPDTIL